MSGIPSVQIPYLDTEDARGKVQNVKELDTVYTGSYGFRDSDALGKVWGRTPAYCIAELKQAFAETGRMYANEYESSRAIKDQLWYVGPFAETVDALIEDMEDRSREEELRDDLRTNKSGYVY